MYDTVVAIDASLRGTGLVLLKTPTADLISRECIRTNEDDPDIESQTHVVSTIFHTVRRLAVGRVAVIIEDYAFGRATGKMYTRAELVGIIKYLMSVVLRYDVYTVTPRALKAYMGDGRADKKDMAVLAKQAFGFSDEDNNIVDAYCLGRMLISLLLGASLPVVKVNPPECLAILQVPANSRIDKPAG